jgi:ABC-2 type transport system permease protein
MTDGADVVARSQAPRTAGLPAPGPLLIRQVRYQLLLLIRTPRALFAGLLLPGGLLALRLGKVSHLGGHVAATTLGGVVAGLAVLGVISTAYVTHATGLVAARQDGVLRRWRATPLPRWGYFSGRVTATVLLADASGAVIVAVGVAMAHLQLSIGSVVSLLLIVTAGAAAWAAVGTAVTSLITTTDSASPVLLASYLPVILLSGAFGSLGGLPGWLTTAMRYLPAQPLVDAATRALQHTGGGFAPVPVHDAAVTGAWIAAGLIGSLLVFRWDPYRPPHAGRPAADGRARDRSTGPTARPAQ